MKDDIFSVKDRLMQALCKKKLLVENDIKKALEIQRTRGGKLSDIVVGMGHVSRTDLVSALSEELGIPPIDLSRYKISAEAIKLIPKNVAKNYHVIPVSKMGNFLTIAIADPLNVFAADDIAQITGHKISVVVANEKDIEEAIAEHYEGGAYEAIEKIIGEIKTKDNIEVLEESIGSEASSQPMQMIADAPVVKIIDMLLSEGVKARASDILIEPMEDSVRVRYRVDGLLKEAQRPPKKIHTALISRLKVISSLNIAEKRLPQDGRFKAKIQNREIDFRISVIPSSNGEKAALRILDKAQAMLDLNKHGYKKDFKASARHDSFMRPHRMW